MKIIAFNIITRLFLFFFFFSLNYRYRYWKERFLGFAYVLKNKSHFHNLGNGTFISHDVVLHNPGDIAIGERVEISRNSTITSWRSLQTHSAPLLIIGDNTVIGEGAHITAANHISLGDDVLLGKFVTITDNSHGHSNAKDASIPPLRREVVSNGGVYIDNRVWIGDKVTILPGVKIGEGAIIGSNSVVTHNIPKYSIAVGVPATVIKNISDQI